MKQETKELLDYIISQFNTRKVIFDGMPDDEKAKTHIYNCRQDKIQDFLNSIPEIESKLCQGGYIQDKNGTPCCHGDKIKFKFSEKDFNEHNEHWKDKYARIEYGELKFDVNDKRFVILFGEDKNGFDWIDWNGAFEGCEWFEKIEG